MINANDIVHKSAVSPTLIILFAFWSRSVRVSDIHTWLFSSCLVYSTYDK